MSYVENCSMKLSFNYKYHWCYIRFWGGKWSK